jgi:hypothetical protein
MSVSLREANLRGTFINRSCVYERSRSVSVIEYRIIIRLIIVPIVLLFALPCQRLEAREPYIGYVYDSWGRAVLSPNGYLPDRAVTGTDIGAGTLRKPQDLFIAADGDIYIVDTGNNRIVVADPTFTLKHTIESFETNSAPEVFSAPEGIFVTPSGEIYVADTGNHRVLVADRENRLRMVLTRPSSDLIPEQMEFLPTKIVVDSTGVIYVLAAGFYYGAVMFSEDGEFLGFYGSNPVERTFRLLADYVWKRLFSREQREKMMRYVPIEYTNFAIDDSDFIYTCTTVSQLSREEIKKLNPMGRNILRGRAGTDDYGDLERLVIGGEVVDTRFVAIAVDDDGFIAALDQTRGRVFQYDQESNLMFIFGNKANQLGTFRSAVDVAYLGNRLLVLDEVKASITVFSLTEYGTWVHRAASLFSEGLYAEAIEPWQEVLRRNGFYELAHIGMAKAAQKTRDYAYAMDHFALAGHREGYSDAFQDYRTRVIRRNFTAIAIGLFFIISILTILMRRKTRKKIGNLIVAIKNRLRQTSQ